MVTMGWWWTSTPRKDDQQSSVQPPAPLETAIPPKPSKPMTRDEQADAELKEFLASLEGMDDARNSRTGASPAPSSHAQFSEVSESQTPSNSIAPESLYPDTMSCRSAFDYAFFCQSFGGQWVNVYRYGELRSCSEHWNNFWFCMKSRAYPDEQRKEAIRDHYRKKAIKYKTGPSSEDVWEVRTEPLRDAFQGDFAALEKQMKEEEEAARQ
jgi:hypothetical protein